MKSNKGITMIALAVTIMVLAILAGISIKVGTTDIQETKQNKYQIELGMIYNAVCQRYTQASLTGEELPGEQLSGSSIEIAKFESATGLSIATGDESEYYKLNKDSLLELGIKNETNEYIVNYEKGMVLNLTRYLENGETIFIDT